MARAVSVGNGDGNPSKRMPGRHRGRAGGIGSLPRLSIIAVAVAGALTARVEAASPNLSYLRCLLAATPPGGWVQASTGTFSASWASQAQGGLPPVAYSNPGTIVRAWSSVAWDSNRGNLLLWGGGHANYMGNEMYVWQGSNGRWVRGSLPTRLEYYGGATYFTVDNASPQSAHTYDNNVFLPINDRFLTFGGASFNDGYPFLVKGPGGGPVIAGPWLWDPNKADPNKVGGLDGSGYIESIAGGRMWSNQRGNWTGGGDGADRGTDHVNGSTAYRAEGGKDVVYVTADSYSSGLPSLYRYQLGAVAVGQPGVFQQVAVSYNRPVGTHAAVIDTQRNLHVQTASPGLSVWDLSVLPNVGGATVDCVFTFAQRSDRCLFDRPISLADPSGSTFPVSIEHGIAYDSSTGKIYLWDSRNQGTVWETQAQYLPDGTLSSTWIVIPRVSTTTAQPQVGHERGVLGKFHYVAELGAIIAMEGWDAGRQDATVWLYKPPATAALPILPPLLDQATCRLPLQ